MNLKTFILALAITFASLGQQPMQRLPVIELEDQFEKAHKIQFPTGKPIFLAVADRESATAMNQWIESAKREFGQSVTYVGIADVRHVPSLLRKMIRQKFQRAYRHPILLDWTGAVTVSLNPKAGFPRIFLASTNGTLLAAESEKFDEEKLARMKAVFQSTDAAAGQIATE